MRFTVDAVSGLAFGAEVNTLESDDDVIQRHLDKIFPAIFRRLLMAAVPTWRWWKIGGRPASSTKASLEVGRRDPGLRRRGAQPPRGEPARRAAPENLLEAMIVAADDPQSGITPGEDPGQRLTMLLAGEDTTANTLAWAIWLLYRHPECLARARAEVDARVGAPARWTIERFAELDYVEACANETLRLRPVVPFLMLQALRETTRRRDPRADRHADLGRAAQRQPARGVLRRARAIQARALDRRRRGAQPASANRVAMPFGAGPRVCPGRHLAMLEIKMALAVLLGRFDIESVVPAGGGAEPAEDLAFTMSPEPLTLRLRRRA